METVTLKNGTIEPKLIVASIMYSLESLLDGKEGIPDILALYDLRELCRNDEYVIPANSLSILTKLNLVRRINNSEYILLTIHPSIRNIVLSALQGEMPDVNLVSPVKTAL